jgi:hypothetical protein
MNNKTWFSVKQIFLHKPENKGIKPWYEERVILILATNEDDANQKARLDGEEYCLSNNETCRFIEIIDTYELYEAEIEDKTEVFSSKTISSLSPDDFVSQFYPDSPSDCEKNGDEHYWHNKDGENSACYNCQVKREGRLWENQND